MSLVVKGFCRVSADFVLPELGENIETGDVLRVLVKAGDTLVKDQAVLELETDKATIEVPSSVAGRVTDIKVKAGDKVKVGQAILAVEEAGHAQEKAAPAKPAQSQPPSAKAEPKASQAVAADSAAKVPGDGGLEQPAEGGKRQAAADKPGVPGVPGENEKRVEARADAEDTEQGDVTSAAARGQKVVDISRGARQTAESPAESELPPAPATPSVRRMARELGVDINDVAGSGPSGRISTDDVKAHVNRIVSGSPTPSVPAAEPLPDFSRWGEIERQPMRGVRRKTAEHLVAAWRAIPHVTQHDVADVTALEEARKRYAKQAEAAGGNLTVTAIAVKVVAAALKVFPQFNVSVDMAAQEIIQRKYIHIGVAVDTDRGLLVPVIRDADTKNITQIAVELSQLSEKARNRKLSLEQMQGGCFSISNLGGIGGTSFTPIVNAPEVAILGISRARMEPVYQRLQPAPSAEARGASERGWGPASIEGDAQLVPRLMLPLSLSYDHRVVDGADGIRFLRWIIEALEQPFLLALQG